MTKFITKATRYMDVNFAQYGFMPGVYFQMLRLVN